MNRIVNMIVRQLVRQLVNKGVSAGVKHATQSKDAGGVPSRPQSDRLAKQSVKVMRRMTRL